MFVFLIFLTFKFLVSLSVFIFWYSIQYLGNISSTIEEIRKTAFTAKHLNVANTRVLKK